jgi:hypothetical protein
MSCLGFHPTVVERPKCKQEAIAAARTAFARCEFDEQGCGSGLRRLRAYRKEWDESRGCGSTDPGGGRIHVSGTYNSKCLPTSAC